MQQQGTQRSVQQGAQRGALQCAAQQARIMARRRARARARSLRALQRAAQARISAHHGAQARARARRKSSLRESSNAEHFSFFSVGEKKKKNLSVQAHAGCKQALQRRGGRATAAANKAAPRMRSRLVMIVRSNYLSSLGTLFAPLHRGARARINRAPPPRDTPYSPRP